ncbi:hypothetical protein R1sor_006856 [Riccia sorocarpa]|uniref:Reverse transcriptase domain-containing protein n=1 Tax=Riccia sorocarpa TaxID=122646 RepID=A0ABD3HSF7_9MARC
MYYQELYTVERETEEILEKRREVVWRIDRRLTLGDNRKLEEVPSEDFITRIVMDMPKEISPGLDGVMVEILRVGWEFMKEDCLRMVKERMGMGADTISRIRGLVEEGTSEVHIKGTFTEAIRIERGVRQGCSLAPLLFAMTTQPLMRALREEERLGNIKGLNIGEDRTLLYQLFAEDIWICITTEENQFARLKEVIADFETTSGAYLNLQKSIVMKLRPGRTPAWLEEAGCEIAEPGKPFLYLGYRLVHK